MMWPLYWPSSESVSHTHTHTHTHIYIHTYTHTHIHTYLYTLIHTGFYVDLVVSSQEALERLVVAALKKPADAKCLQAKLEEGLEAIRTGELKVDQARRIAAVGGECG